MKTKIKNHKHTWIVTSIAIVLAVITIIVLPKNKEYSLLFLGFASGHLIIFLIAVFTGWMLIPQKFLKKIWPKNPDIGFDFGWSPKWVNSFLAASLLVFIIALYLYFSLEGSPAMQLVVYSILFMLSINFFIGYVIFSNSSRRAQLTLPMVTLLPDGKGKVLDAGSGAGRTTIALAQAIPGAEIVAFDKFDADYIDEGGLGLLKHNIKLAGIENRISVESGDITATSFNENCFDAIISSYMFDHLGPHKRKALTESFRILKPGGRFLLIIAIRNYSTFGIANVLCLLFPSRNKWKRWIEQAGFKMVCDGKINEGAYFCFEKPM